VFVANYGGGNVAVFHPWVPTRARRGFGREAGALAHATVHRAVDDPPGQFAVSDHDSPHVHMVAADPSGQFVIANDAGLDLTLSAGFDSKAGRLLPADVPVVAAPSGSARATSRFIRTVEFFTTSMSTMQRLRSTTTTPRKGRASTQATCPALPPKFSGSNLSAGNSRQRRRPVMWSNRLTIPSRFLRWRMTVSCG